MRAPALAVFAATLVLGATLAPETQAQQHRIPGQRPAPRVQSPAKPLIDQLKASLVSKLNSAISYIQHEPRRDLRSPEPRLLCFHGGFVMNFYDRLLDAESQQIGEIRTAIRAMMDRFAPYRDRTHYNLTNAELERLCEIEDLMNSMQDFHAIDGYCHVDGTTNYDQAFEQFLLMQGQFEEMVRKLRQI